MPDEQVIDSQVIATLRELSPESGDEFVRELIEIYLQDTPRRLAEIEQALGKQDAVTLTRAAHTIKGSSSNFGATRLSKVAQEIEMCGKAGDLPAAAAICGRLKTEYAQVALALEQVARGSQPPAR